MSQATSSQSSRTKQATIEGEKLDFVAENERLVDRVEKVSNEEYLIGEIVDCLQLGDVFWDVGACLGIHSLAIASKVQSGLVYAFEPMPSNREVLSQNTGLNDLENVHVAHQALADERGIGSFDIRQSMEPGYGRHSLKHEGYDRVRNIHVRVDRGDDLQYESPNIVKIDVEGAEGAVIDGMEDRLAHERCRHVFVETHEPNDVQPSNEDFGYTVEELKQQLESLGFRVEEMDERYHLHGQKVGSL